MINNLLFILLALYGFTQPVQGGYEIKGETMLFIYPSLQADVKVYVNGNFNGWASDSPDWKMNYDDEKKAYVLAKEITRIKKPGLSFYEFAFRVDNQLVDANPKNSNVIHCPGYGYRYVIKL